MKSTRKLVVTHLLLLLILSLSSTNTLTAQQTLTTINGWNAYVHLPDDYNQTGAQTYPTIIFFPGLGEVGTNASQLLNNGPSHFISTGWNGNVLVNGVTIKPIIISLQPDNAYPQPAAIDLRIETIKSLYRVDINNLHLTGLSHGGWCVEMYVQANSTYASKVSSIVAIQAMTPADNPAYPAPFATYANLGGHWLGYEQRLDFRDMATIANTINNAVNGNATYFETNVSGGGHCCWNTWYDPAHTDNYVLNGTSGNWSIYQYMLQWGSNASSNQGPIANAGNDVTITLPTVATLLNGSGTDPDGTISTYNWTKISGPSTFKILNIAAAQTSVTNLILGIYQFELRVTDASSSTDRDTVTVTVSPAQLSVSATNYMLRNTTPCRAGTKQKFTLGNTQMSGGVVSTTAIYMPYMKRDGFFPTMQGGDTLVIVRNPNNGGVWQQIELGDFGGNFGCPIVIVSDSITTIRNAGSSFKLASRDSNFAPHIKIDGLANRLTKGVVYGFQYDNGPLANDPNALGFNANLVHHLEVCGMAIINVGVGVFVKINSNPLYPWKQYGNFTMQNLYFHDMYLHRINGEGFYVGHTDIAGNVQAGNSGPTVAADSVRFSRIIIDSTAWDGLQISHAGVNAEIERIVAYRTGSQNMGSQQWSIFIGGNTQGSIHDCVAIDATGPLGILGKGTSSIYNNFIDDVDNGLTDADGVYITQALTGVPLPVDPLKVFSHDNIIRNVVRNAIFHADNNNTMLRGAIRNNIFVGTAGAVTNAQDTVENNLTTATYNVAAAMSGRPAYEVYLLVRSQAGRLYSFFDIGASPNQPPVANAGNDITITLPTNSVTLNGSGTDADGSVVSYNWTKIAGPTQFNITSAANAQTSITNLVQGIYQFQLQVTDNDGSTDRDTVMVTVNAGSGQNIPPVANAGLNISITLPISSVTLLGSATDADGSIVSYSWTKIAGPAPYSIQSATSAVTIVSILTQGVYQFQLLVTDNGGATDMDTVIVTVNSGPPPPPNISPVANAGNDINITLPTNTASLNGSGTDADGSVVSYAWTKIAGPAQFNIVAAANAQTTVNNLVQGVYQFQLRVTDNGGASSTDIVIITVNAATPSNIPPVANAGFDLNITLPTNTASLNGSGTDADGSVVSYAWTKIAGPAQFNIVAAANAQTTVNNLVQGVYQFQLRVTDNGGATGTDIVIITVNAAPPPPPNIAPVANAGTDINITLPTSTASLNGSGTDANGTIVGYTWTKIAGPAQFNIVNATIAQTTVNNLVQGIYQFQLRVTDNGGATDLDTVSVTVNAAPPPLPNIPPVANADIDINITLPTNTTILNGSGTDADGSVVSYAWIKIAGPAQSSIVNSALAQTPVNNLEQGVYQFQLRVTDNDGATDLDTVFVSVNAGPPPPPNITPVANAGNDISITLPTNTASLNGSGTDADGSIVTILWTKIAGPAQFNIASTANAQTTVNNLVEGVYQFQFLVVDNNGAIDIDLVIVTVNAAALPPTNIPPVANAGVDIAIELPQTSVVLTGSGTDADGTIAGYLWTKISGPAQFIIVSNTQAQTQVNGLAEGTYVFELRVTDNNGGIDIDNVTVIVDPLANRRPVANAGIDKTLTLPVDSIMLQGSGVDPDGTIVSYSWRCIFGQGQYRVLSPGTSQTEVDQLAEGTYQFELKVTDNYGAFATDTLQVFVKNFGNSKVSIFPNPARNIVNIKVDANTLVNVTSLIIYNVKGIAVHKEVFMRNQPSITKQVNISKLPSGVYFIEVSVNINRKLTCKMLKL